MCAFPFFNQPSIQVPADMFLWASRAHFREQQTRFKEK